MNQREFIVLIIIAAIILLAALDTFLYLKSEETVHSKRGKIPYQPRFDKEESLKEAWFTEKRFHSWGNETDDLTWYDLDMFEVFEGTNSTYSSVGSEALYQRLRSFDFGEDQQLEKLIAFYQENLQLREKIRYQFARLGKKDHNFAKQYLADGKSKKIGRVGLFIFPGLLPLTGIGLLPLGQVLGIYLAIGGLVFDTVYYLVKKQTLETELNSTSYLVSMTSATNRLVKLPTLLQEELKQQIKLLRDIPKLGFSFHMKNGSEAELILEYVSIMFMPPFISYHFVLTKLEKHSTEAIKLWELPGELEVAAVILNYRTYISITRHPELTGGGVTARDIHHPLSKEAVVNPVNWQKNTLVTGSNASGESTHVKSIAISCTLAQTIQTAIAEQFTLQSGHVLTPMAIEDGLFEGDSYSASEIKPIERSLDQVVSKERCYCFVDEILKGTNTIERIVSPASVVQRLAEYPSLAFVATHDIESTETLENYCENVHFEGQVTEGKGISFDFRLKEGSSRTRNAIALLKVLDYPETSVETAKTEAASFDEKWQWHVLG